MAFAAAGFASCWDLAVDPDSLCCGVAAALDSLCGAAAGPRETAGLCQGADSEIN